MKASGGLIDEADLTRHRRRELVDSLLVSFEPHVGQATHLPRIGTIDAVGPETHGWAEGMTVGVGWAVAVLAMAALSTLLLVRVSRQATLRQVNANLLVISEQLQRLGAAGS